MQNIIDKHKNKPCIILGHGPSLNKINKRLRHLKDIGYLLIACNDWFEFHITPDYWIMANPAITIEDNINMINKKNVPVFFSKATDHSNINDLIKNIIVDFLPYHQYPHPDYDIFPEDSIQQELIKYTGHNERYGVGASVGLHMIAFAILMGCNPIYISGIDVDYNLGYAINDNPDNTIDFFKKNCPEILQDDYKENVISDLLILNEAATDIGINIYYANHLPCYDIFKRKNI